MKLTVWLPWLFCQVLENLEGFGQPPPLTPIKSPVLFPPKIAFEYLLYCVLNLTRRPVGRQCL